MSINQYRSDDIDRDAYAAKHPAQSCICPASRHRTNDSAKDIRQKIDDVSVAKLPAAQRPMAKHNHQVRRRAQNEQNRFRRWLRISPAAKASRAITQMGLMNSIA